jgi:hypothetical protein
MTDITKCIGFTKSAQCPMCESCYRYTAKTGERQSWFAQVPMYQLCEGSEWKCEAG